MIDMQIGELEGCDKSAALMHSCQKTGAQIHYTKVYLEPP